jgi:hypothetical protein
MDLEARMAEQPAPDQLGLVGPVVVEDQVDVKLGGDLLFETVQEGLELGRTVTPVRLADHLAGGDVEGGEERGGAGPAVVVGSPLGDARCQGQDGLGAVEGLDLALLVDARDHRPVGRVEVETDDVADLLDELGVVGELEGLHAVELQAVGVPDPVHGVVAEAAGFGHAPGAPVGGVLGHLPQGHGQDRLDLVIADAAGRSTAGFIEEPSQAALDIAGAPLADGVVRDSQLPGHLSAGEAVGAAKDDAGPLRQAIAGLGAPRPGEEFYSVGLGDDDGALWGRPRCMT